MTIEELKKEALRLAPEGRASLARELLSSLDSLNDAEIEQLWIEEAIRRDKELDSGAASASPAGGVLDRARARRK
ncbi:MAG: addiction module antitoxin RelB [Ignavibacteriales bacterium CG07_land_8_20_14_0_80_59_12]|nr:MAG: addiction module antitoxin RelB [Ignavibacteriales bacterium CG07_land_8_20_14_0_80_59_12]